MTFTISANGYSISIDSKERGADIDFVSHAHTDHIGAVRSSKNVLSSYETAYLIEKTYGMKVRRCLNIPDGIRLLDAGHMLGSSQLSAMDYVSGNKIVYTGDYLLQESRVAKRISIEDTDIAIVDSTYPDPRIKFDDRQEVERSIQLWAKTKMRSGTIIFGAYTLGKAQELTSILNDAGIEPILSKRLAAATDAYNNLGMGLRYQSACSEEAGKQIVGKNAINIVESNSLNKTALMLRQSGNTRVYTAVATGFAAIFRFNTNVQFQLSDHADFSQCLEYVERSNAKKIYTRGNGAKALAAALGHKGYDAEPYSASVELNLAQPVSIRPG